ncbi:MAG: NAD(P)(+) transhydrogenase (Re/Si-specific) subunit alpha, partial [Gammaproteobacteria bacterium]|nr:NAD(P)(+) transhydrogenase (Re/Si-specific) subunit alpha [Gemmatimonadota bacterium]NIU74044.1 NAD(P)(+) transhydrogenase (Re/Si-specific) subunit alpha [Gammaproteobacteria bacterium]
PDEAYEAAGATATADPLEGADVVLSVQPLPADRVRNLKADALTISFLPVHQELDLVRAFKDAKVTSFSMELIPRISRAQAM